jgi:hypothetical protein
MLMEEEVEEEWRELWSFVVGFVEAPMRVRLGGCAFVP